MRLAWLTDIHLNFLDTKTRRKFYKAIIHTKCDAVLISGDIAEAPFLSDILNEAVSYINQPIYFVLGNHDYYRGQINDVRSEMTLLTKGHRNVFYLPASGIQKLNQDTILVGQDGWADGRLGDYQHSRVELNDSRMILDLFQESMLGKDHLLKKMQTLADKDALQLQYDLEQAISLHPKKIIVLTHVSPFKETCFYQGKMSNEDWLPFFTSKIMGEVLRKVAHENQAIKFLVLCGHTHHEANYRSANLIVEAGKARYGQPEVQKIIEI